MRVALIILLWAYATNAKGPITVGTGDVGEDKLDLSGTDLSQEYCVFEKKECKGEDLTASFAPTVQQVISKCNRHLDCMGVFLDDKRVAYERAGRCTHGQLTASTGTFYYRLKAGESCPDGSAAYTKPKNIYSPSFCKAEGKACPGHGIYMQPWRIMNFMDCLVKCTRILTCAGVDFHEGAERPCEPLNYMCKDSELVDKEGTTNYQRLEKGVTTCSGSRTSITAGPEPPKPTTTEKPKPTTINGLPIRECMPALATHYTGTLDLTKSKKKCRAWAKPGANIGYLPKDDPAKYMPETKIEDAKNYCRAPENNAYLWCYTSDSGDWDKCYNPPGCPPESALQKPKPVVRECMPAQYKEYSGTLDLTKTGKKCRSWTMRGSDNSWLPARDPTKYMVERRIEDAKNYCRVGDNKAYIWCYVDYDGTWEKCYNPPGCPPESALQKPKPVVKECLPAKYTDYSGTLAVTNTGKKCRSWTMRGSINDWLPARDPTKYMVERRIEDAKNYCRAGDNKAYLWCYTTYDGSWEKCTDPVKC